MKTPHKVLCLPLILIQSLALHGHGFRLKFQSIWPVLIWHTPFTSICFPFFGTFYQFSIAWYTNIFVIHICILILIGEFGETVSAPMLITHGLSLVCGKTTNIFRKIFSKKENKNISISCQ